MECSKSSNDLSRPVLSVVIPVYNEESAIAEVISSWADELEERGIDHEIQVYDDGSNDRTWSILEDLAARYPRLVVRTQVNKGHGPTILRGYKEARGEWVFQVDGDDAMGPGGFEALWALRESYDFLLGARQYRRSPLWREIITLASRLSVWALFSIRVHDVNTPYRLMRSSCLRSMLPLLPADSFAPNLILAGIAARQGFRIYECSLSHWERKTGRGSIGWKWKFWKGAFLAFKQTVQVARKLRSGGGGMK